MPWVYILKCSDGSYYVGSTFDLDVWLAEHQLGLAKGYTHSRRPVELVYSDEFDSVEEAFYCERQIKGWRREKKEALIRGDYEALPELSRTSKQRTASG
ncbi:MAG: GIY-YIG nuclease family protein [Chloroflexi bacterium]|nr:GIY-YIG nuclease family protein [Chloroflexota bacterium]